MKRRLPTTSPAENLLEAATLKQPGGKPQPHQVTQQDGRTSVLPILARCPAQVTVPTQNTACVSSLCAEVRITHTHPFAQPVAMSPCHVFVHQSPTWQLRNLLTCLHRRRLGAETPSSHTDECVPHCLVLFAPPTDLNLTCTQIRDARTFATRVRRSCPPCSRLGEHSRS